MRTSQRQIIRTSRQVSLLVDSIPGGFSVSLWNRASDRYERVRVIGSPVSESDVDALCSALDSGLSLDAALAETVGAA